VVALMWAHAMRPYGEWRSDIRCYRGKPGSSPAQGRGIEILPAAGLDSCFRRNDVRVIMIRCYSHEMGIRDFGSL